MSDEPVSPLVADAIQPTTTAEQQRLTAIQRRINLVWEWTQSAIALMVTAVTLCAATALVVRPQTDAAAFLLLSNAFFLVVGFYFGRSREQRAGSLKGDSYENRERNGNM